MHNNSRIKLGELDAINIIGICAKVVSQLNAGPFGKFCLKKIPKNVDFSLSGKKMAPPKVLNLLPQIISNFRFFAYRGA